MPRLKKKPDYNADQIMQIMATLIKSADDVWVRRENEDGRDLVAMDVYDTLNLPKKSVRIP